MRTIFKRLLEKAGLRDIRVDDLRHSFASLLLQQGESVVYVEDQLGHASIQLTVDTYGHLIPGANRAAVDRLDDAPTHLSGSQADPEPEDASAGDQPKSFVLSGDPNIHQLEPNWRVAPAD
jgi:integrase